MKIIPLTQGYSAFVDDEDYEYLDEYKWYAMKVKRLWYAVRNSSLDADGHKHLMLMHRIILRAKRGQQIDHADGNGLNNQRFNIRFSTQQENQQNQTQKRLNATSRFKGVHWSSRYLKWQAEICDGEKMKNGKSRKRYLGRYNVEEDAARAYDEAAQKSFGEFAALNFSVK